MEENKLTNTCCGQKKGVCLALGAILGIFLVAVTVFMIINTQKKIKEMRNLGVYTVSFSGEGDVYAKPDLAQTSFSVVSQAKTVAQAMQDNTEKMNKVIEAVKNQGVDEKDLKTTYFNLSPRYDYRTTTGVQIYPYPSGQRILSGYDVNQTLSVKIRDLTKIGSIIEASTSAGANEVGNLSLTIDKQDELQNQARKAAIEQAKSKAQELASELGVKLVRITNFNENSAYPMYALDKNIAAVPSPMGGATPQIETGENKITVNVNITYEIQ